MKLINVKTAIMLLGLGVSTMLSAANVKIEKSFLYDQYTLDDVYPYKDGSRQFQWDKISQSLALVDSLQMTPATWGILQNNKNKNGEAALVKDYHMDEYRRPVDQYNIERYQNVPLYSLTDLTTPQRYGQDGALVKILPTAQDSEFFHVYNVYLGSEWMVPKKYVHIIEKDLHFNKVIFIDRTNQNIATMEEVNSVWLVRSMNPATTGAHHPPYQMPTPTGIFVLQEKKPRMLYYIDGTTEYGGFAPHANRFSTGAYIHGVPVNTPAKKEIEFSPSLGTIPRSHKCVRNATSHAKFIYDWAPEEETLIFVFD